MNELKTLWGLLSQITGSHGGINFGSQVKGWATRYASSRCVDPSTLWGQWSGLVHIATISQFDENMGGA